MRDHRAVGGSELEAADDRVAAPDARSRRARDPRSLRRSHRDGHDPTLDVGDDVAVAPVEVVDRGRESFDDGPQLAPSLLFVCVDCRRGVFEARGEAGVVAGAVALVGGVTHELGIDDEIVGDARPDSAEVGDRRLDAPEHVDLRCGHGRELCGGGGAR